MITNLLKQSLVVFNSAPVASTPKAPCYAGFICTKSVGLKLNDAGNLVPNPDGEPAIWKGFERILMILLFFIISHMGYAQGWAKKIDNASSLSTVKEVILNDDYVLAGLVRNEAGALKTGMMRLDSVGSEKWRWIYENYNGSLTDCIKQNSYLIATGGLGNLYAVKTDLNGNALWTRTHGDSLRYETGTCVLATSDGGYLFCGIQKDLPNSSTHWYGSGYFVKTDSMGNVLWQRYIHESTMVPNPEYMFNSDGASMQGAYVTAVQSPDGGYLVAYSSESTSMLSEQGGTGTGVLFFLKLNSEGELVWWKAPFGNYDEGVIPYNVGVVDMIPEADGFLTAGTILPANYNSWERFHLAKYDWNADLLWEYRYDTIPQSYWTIQMKDYCRDLEVLPNDKGYLLSGGEWLIRVSAAGEELWRRKMPVYGIRGAVYVPSDGGFALAGRRFENSNYPLYLLKTDSLGSCAPVSFFGYEAGMGSGYSVQFTDLSGQLGNYSRVWDFGDGSSPADTSSNPLHAYPSAGSYEVCLKITNICDSAKYCQTVGVAVGTNEVSASSSTAAGSLSGWQSGGRLYVRYSGTEREQASWVRLLDVLGREVIQLPLSSYGGGVYGCELPTGIPAGIYLAVLPEFGGSAAKLAVGW